jgi:ParB-like chromosome segregation protein Spo0J
MTVLKRDREDWIDPKAIVRWNNPRSAIDVDHVHYLGLSILQVGQITPGVVVEEEDGSWTGEAGQHRALACEERGLLFWAHFYKAPLTRQQRDSLRIVTNTLHLDLTPFERLRYVLVTRKITGRSIRSICSEISMDPSYFVNNQGIFDLEQPLLDLLAEEKINVDTASALTKVKDADTRLRLAHEAAEKKIVAKDIKALVSGNGKKKAKPFTIKFPPGMPKGEKVALVRAVLRELEGER